MSSLHRKAVQKPGLGQCDMAVAYPINLLPILEQSGFAVDALDSLLREQLPLLHPGLIVWAALMQWNRWLLTQKSQDSGAFLRLTQWLAEHVSDIQLSDKREQNELSVAACGWPIASSHDAYHTYYLSSTVQGCGLSVLVRAYHLTQDRTFLTRAKSVAATFTLDILDGGTCSPICTSGIFFEEVATYPASHILSGHLFGLLGLIEYRALIDDAADTKGATDTAIEKAIDHGLATLKKVIGSFDTGYWTNAGLQQGILASRQQHSMHCALLEAIAHYDEDEFLVTIATRWRSYEQHVGAHVRVAMTRRVTQWQSACWQRVQRMLFPRPSATLRTRVCVALPDFPTLGGVLTVLKGIAHVMDDSWEIEYLTQYVGPQPDGYVIHKFGTRRMTPWYFPFVWLYVITGAWKSISLQRRGAGYQLLLPQDGVFSALFAGIAGKLAGIRVVCIDHGNLSFFTPRNMAVYRAERIQALTIKRWPWFVRQSAKHLLSLYWPSLVLLARCSTRLVDHFLIPGVVGDSVDEGCTIIGIPPERVTRYGSMIDLSHHPILHASEKAALRQSHGIDADAMVVAIVCRLSPEKGLDIALDCLQQALDELATEQRERVRVVIAGEGPLRQQIEADIARLGLSTCCELWGELSATRVTELLGISDIFLYTSMRGACMAMSVLEAMASGCAVIASTEPLANEVLLADGRGIAIAAGDREQTRQALLHLFSDRELCRRMGREARAYIALQHSPAIFKRTLLRVGGWSKLDTFLQNEMKEKHVHMECDEVV